MEKRLTMFFVSLFLCVGSVLAQTKVTGTVYSQKTASRLSAPLSKWMEHRPVC